MSFGVDDIVQIVVPYTYAGGSVINDFGLVCISGSGHVAADTLSDFKTAIVKATTGGLLTVPANVYSVDHLELVDVKPGTAATVPYTFSAVTGIQTGDALPPQCAALLRLTTSLKGRSYRGRIYLPPGDESEQANGTWNSTMTTNLNDVCTQLKAVYGPGGSNAYWRLCVVSRYHNGAKRPTPVATQITDVTYDSRVRTQRRRVSGVGS